MRLANVLDSPTAENYKTRRSNGMQWRYVPSFHEYPGASGHNKPWALCTERKGGRTSAKDWHCYQNKVKPDPNKTDKRTVTAKLKLLKISFVCKNIKKKTCALF
jgi:hypothetical protein